MTYSTEIPGLPGGPLITTYPIHLRILPSSMTRNRPGIKARQPRRSVQHGNGNPNSSAAGEASYLNNGAEGRQASYHAASDDKEVWVMIPADEVTWQSADGDGPGNMNGFSDEMVEDAVLWANPTRRDRCIAITADFMGRVSARLNIAKPERHWDFNFNNAPSERHHCPDKLMSVRIGGRLAWDIYVDQWQAAKADELKRMNPAPAKPTAYPIWWDPGAIGPQKRDDGTLALAMWAEVRVKTAKGAQLRQSVNGKVLKKVPAGTRLVLRGTHVSDKRSKWAFVALPGEPNIVYRVPLVHLDPKYPTI